MTYEGFGPQSSDDLNPPKVYFSVLNQDENVSMAPEFYSKRCQWLQNIIPICLNGSIGWQFGAIDTYRDSGADEILEPLTNL